MFLNAEPLSIGTISPAMVPSRMAARRSSAVISSSPRYFSRMFVVEAGEHVDELVAVLVGLVLQVGGDLDDVPLGAELLVVPDEGLHLDEVDDALVVALGADRAAG